MVARLHFRRVFLAYILEANWADFASLTVAEVATEVAAAIVAAFADVAE